MKPIPCCIFVFFVVVNTPRVNSELPGTVCIKRSRVLYQQNCVNAAVVLWVICHLGVFTWDRKKKKIVSYNIIIHHTDFIYSK